MYTSLYTDVAVCIRLTEPSFNPKGGDPEEIRAAATAVEATIKRREDLMRQIRTAIGSVVKSAAALQGGGSDHKAFSAGLDGIAGQLHALRDASMAVVDSVVRWRRTVDKAPRAGAPPLVYQHAGENYLLKMCSDLQFLESRLGHTLHISAAYKLPVPCLPAYRLRYRAVTSPWFFAGLRRSACPMIR